MPTIKKGGRYEDFGALVCVARFNGSNRVEIFKGLDLNGNESIATMIDETAFVTHRYFRICQGVLLENLRELKKNLDTAEKLIRTKRPPNLNQSQRWNNKAQINWSAPSPIELDANFTKQEDFNKVALTTFKNGDVVTGNQEHSPHLVWGLYLKKIEKEEVTSTTPLTTAWVEQSIDALPVLSLIHI